MLVIKRKKQNQTCAVKMDTKDERNPIELLEKAIIKVDYKSCQHILEKMDVNTPLQSKSGPLLLIATKKNKADIVRLLGKYNNSEESKRDALLVILHSPKNINMDVIKELLLIGAQNVSPMELGHFFKQCSWRDYLCRDFVKLVCECSQAVQTVNASRFLLLEALLNLVVIVTYRLHCGLPESHRFVEGWSNYSLVYYLLKNGANPHSLWTKNKLAYDGWLVAWPRNSVEFPAPVISPDYPIISLLIRTSLDAETRSRGELSASNKLASFLFNQVFNEIYKEANPNHGINLALGTQLNKARFPVIDNLKNFMRILTWTGNFKIKDNLIKFEQHILQNSNTTLETSGTLNQVHEIGLNLGQLLPLTLQQCCRLEVQRCLKGPNLIYSVNQIPGLPRSMKELILLENTVEVLELEPEKIREEMFASNVQNIEKRNCCVM